MKEYAGVKLEEKEADALISLEKRIQKTLKHRNFYPNDMDYFTGFYSVNNSVVHLSMQNEYSLKEFPNEILDFQELRILSITESNINNIPNDISRLKYLKILAIDGCRNITVLPDSIGCLINLEELWLEFCSIENIPNSIGNLKSLKQLNLEDNRFKILPESIGKLENLEILYLYDNKFHKLPESIGRLKSLKRLVVSSNPNLKDLPNSILDLESLEHLGIDTKNISLESRKLVNQLRERGVEINLL